MYFEEVLDVALPVVDLLPPGLLDCSRCADLAFVLPTAPFDVATAVALLRGVCLDRGFLHRVLPLSAAGFVLLFVDGPGDTCLVLL